MTTSASPHVFWDFCRTTHADGSKFEHQVPILRCPEKVPEKLSIGAYQVKITQGGLVIHEWEEKKHIDPLSTWRDGAQSGFEIAVYDDGLHGLNLWRVGQWGNGVGQVFKVVVPPKPTIDAKEVLLRKVEKEAVFAFSIVGKKRGVWEWVRQKINKQGVYTEQREWGGFMGEEKEIKADVNAVYDAILITRDGWEEKFILKGTMDEVSRCVH